MPFIIKKPVVGRTYHDVLVEVFLQPGYSRPRVRPVTKLPKDLVVEFPMHLREKDSRFLADILVCMKTNADGSPRGQIYLRASNIRERRSTLKPGSKSGRAYVTDWYAV